MTESFTHLYFVVLYLLYVFKVDEKAIGNFGAQQRGNNNQFPTESEAPASKGDITRIRSFLGAG